MHCSGGAVAAIIMRAACSAPWRFFLNCPCGENCVLSIKIIHHCICVLHFIFIKFMFLSFFFDKKMSEESDKMVQLVKLIEHHPCLFDYNRGDYSNDTTKQDAWVLISNEINISGNYDFYN